MEHIQRLQAQLERDNKELNAIKATIEVAEKALDILDCRNSWMEGHPWVELHVFDVLKDDYPTCRLVEVIGDDFKEFQPVFRQMIERRIQTLKREQERLVHKWDNVPVK